MTSPQRFADLPLHKTLQQNVAHFETPTPIQQAAIPPVLEGKDVVAIAQTGTGKTAAFALPLLHRLISMPSLAKQAQAPASRATRALVLTPTRELAAQIGEGLGIFGKSTGLRHEVIFGGVSEHKQRIALRDGVDVLVATPGRLLDLMSQKVIAFPHVETFILDEADRMLDMGFLPDVKRVIAALPTVRQTLLFSATMPDDITALAQRILRSPVRVEVTPPSTTVERIAQSVYFVGHASKRALLLELLGDPDVTRVLIFTRTKHGANRVAEHLDKHGVPAAAIHGNKSQGARERALAGFKAGTLRALVATDIAARGIDVDGVSHVIQIDLPEVPEQYVHRIGRTARAGRDGVAWAFVSQDDVPLLKQIERTIRLRVPVAEHSFGAGNDTGPPPDDRGPPPGRGGRGGRGGPGRGGPRGGGGGGARPAAAAGGGRGPGGGGGGPSRPAAGGAGGAGDGAGRRRRGSRGGAGRRRPEGGGPA